MVAGLIGGKLGSVANLKVSTRDLITFSNYAAAGFRESIMNYTFGCVLSNCVASGWHIVREFGGEIQSESRMRKSARPV